MHYSIYQDNFAKTIVNWVTPNCDTVIDNPSFKIYSHAFPEIACEHGIDFHLSLLLIEKMLFC